MAVRFFPFIILLWSLVDCFGGVEGKANHHVRRRQQQAGTGQRNHHHHHRPPNFIIIQPDDHYFFEEWNPPARFAGRFAYNMDGILTSMNTAPTSNGMTPNIDRLRDQGLEMTNAYAASTM